MSSAWGLLFWAANPSRRFSLCLYTSVLYFILFYCCPPFPPPPFLFRFVAHSFSLSLSFCLGCLALLICFPFLLSLLRRMFFLPYAYHMSLSFVYIFSFCLSFVSWISLLNPFLVTISLAGYFHVCFLPSDFPVCLLFLRPCSFPVCFGLTLSIL